MEQRLCPRCGAYWACDCTFDTPSPPKKRDSAPSDLNLPAVICNHDWVEVVGVEIDEGASDETARVMGCRLCGLYAVKVES